jgi:hypothetical protein
MIRIDQAGQYTALINSENFALSAVLDVTRIFSETNLSKNLRENTTTVIVSVSLKIWQLNVEYSCLEPTTQIASRIPAPERTQ